jgi:hypothetical protein
MPTGPIGREHVQRRSSAEEGCTDDRRDGRARRHTLSSVGVGVGVGVGG